jgi:hypothetical protein
VPPADFLTPNSSKWRALLTHRGLSERAKVLMCWLIFAADVRSGTVADVTQTGLAGEFGWSPQTVRRVLDELIHAGMIAAHLPRGRHTGGSITVAAYYDVMKPTRWLSRQRAIGAQ